MPQAPSDEPPSRHAGRGQRCNPAYPEGPIVSVLLETKGRTGIGRTLMTSYRRAATASLLLLALVAPTTSRAGHESRWGHLPLLAKAEQPTMGGHRSSSHYDGVGSGLFWGVHRGKAAPNFIGSC